MLLNVCICPQGYAFNLTYQCTTFGIGNTLWKGSAFNCVGNGDEISLQHSLFARPGGTTAQCGNITARSLNVEDNFYTSQISAVFSPDLIGHSIECVYDNSQHLAIVGNSIIAITTGSYI